MEINELTYQINGAIFDVNRELGAGFLEKVYENALMIAPFSSAMSAEEKVCVCLWLNKEFISHLRLGNK